MQHLACRESEFGQGCIQQCLCQNGALCNAVNGACTCTAGYTGVNCEIGKIKILLLCVCAHVCVCVCVPGNLTLLMLCLPSTSAECNSGSFGLKCSSTCTCQNGAACDPVSGACTCQPGWREANCSKREY